MLPVSLRFNISIVHLLLFTLIPKRTPKGRKKKREEKKKQIFYGAGFSHLNHFDGSPDQQLTVGTIHVLYGI